MSKSTTQTTTNTEREKAKSQIADKVNQIRKLNAEVIKLLTDLGEADLLPEDNKDPIVVKYLAFIKNENEKAVAEAKKGFLRKDAHLTDFSDC
jgi:hypothetical protein